MFKSNIEEGTGCRENKVARVCLIPLGQGHGVKGHGIGEEVHKWFTEQANPWFFTMKPELIFWP